MPRSLAGQMLLLLGLALFVAQLANFALILNERQKLSLAQNQGPAITRFAGVAADLEQAAPEFRAAIVADASHRGARFQASASPGIDERDRDAAVEARLVTALAEQAVAASDVRGGLEAGNVSSRNDRQYLILTAKLPSGGWLTGRLATPRRDPFLALRLGAATLLLFLIVLGATMWIALRLARPLLDLTRAAEAFGGRTEFEPVPSSGPSDLRRAIDAFNAMNRRVVALLDEKDRMLGAIGHDLRTPLASLRIRVESMEPEGERDAAISKIAEMTAMLEDILMLARTGRAREEAKPTDLRALVESIVEDAREAGHDVDLVAPERFVTPVHAPSIARALRNLLDNALLYAGSARIQIESMPDQVAIRVIDTGSGIPDDQICAVLQPFVRLEGSRSRETGGTGLGLPIAASIAESHGGRLVLRSNSPNGLVATIIFPRAPR